jgi:hypothetical protein
MFSICSFQAAGIGQPKLMIRTSDGSTDRTLDFEQPGKGRPEWCDDHRHGSAQNRTGGLFAKIRT